MADLSTISIIGSFRQHYAEVLRAHEEFQRIGLSVLSPKGSSIVEHGIQFVRFTSDHEIDNDAMVQTVALDRILASDIVYVVTPNGYVGRTTCYEIGRIIQARRPLYFSEHPDDLPIEVPPNHILSPEELARRILDVAWSPLPLFAQSNDDYAQLETRLLSGDYRHD